MIHKLKPFSEAPFNLNFEAEVSFLQTSSSLNLAITYRLNGAHAVLNEINLLSDSITTKQKSHELWKNTCFEWFIKSKTSSKYWEFNASPSGQWNFYEFDSYRSNLKECFFIVEPCFQSKLRSETVKSQASKSVPDPTISDLNSSYSFSFEGSLEPLLNHENLKKDDLQLAITSVVNWKNGQISYYSLEHGQGKPDFHSNEGFILPFPSR